MTDVASTDDTKHAAAAPQRLTAKLKLAISCLVLLHAAAVFLPPMAFQADVGFGGSPSVATLLRPLEGYSQFMYLDRGYAFFAPDPGPSHLIQAAVTDPDGQLVESLYPDLDHQWPRLNYHRHFMLAEFLNDLYQRPGPPPQLIEEDPEAAAQWARLRQRYERVRRSISDHLSHVHGGKDVKIRRIEHLIPGPVEFLQESIDLADERLYIVLLDQPVDAPLGPPETIPPPQQLRAPQSEASVSGDSPLGTEPDGPGTAAESAEETR